MLAGAISVLDGVRDPTKGVTDHLKGITMRKLALAGFVAVFAIGSSFGTALAQDTCRSQAVGKDGKALSGAALHSFMTKCTKTACEAKAVDKNGRTLSGAAKASFMKKCQSKG